MPHDSPDATLTDTLRHVAALCEAAGFDALVASYDTPSAPSSRSLPDVLDAINIVESELGHHIKRIVQRDTFTLADQSHLLDLAAQYANARRAIGLLRRHLAGRLTSSARIAPESER